MTLARFISFIANPIFIFMILPYFLVLKTTRDTQAAWTWTIYTLGFIIIFVMLILAGVKKKFLSDLDVSNRKQRPLIYFICAILAILYIAGLFILQGPPILFITIIGIMLGIVVGFLINTKIKVSVHVATISTLLTSLSLVYKGYFLLLLLLIPIICWSRVKIKRHTVPEVVVGGIVGCLLSLITYFSTKSFIIP